MKKKGRAKGKDGDDKATAAPTTTASGGNEPPLKKKRMVNGAVVTFRKPGEGSGEESDGDEGDVGPTPAAADLATNEEAMAEAVPQAEGAKLTIIEDE